MRTGAAPFGSFEACQLHFVVGFGNYSNIDGGDQIKLVQLVPQSVSFPRCDLVVCAISLCYSLTLSVDGA